MSSQNTVQVNQIEKDYLVYDRQIAEMLIMYDFVIIVWRHAQCEYMYYVHNEYIPVRYCNEVNLIASLALFWNRQLFWLPSEMGILFRGEGVQELHQHVTFSWILCDSDQKDNLL